MFHSNSSYHELVSETKTKLFYKDNPLAIRFKNKKLLPERYRKIFASRQIACIEFSGLEDEEIRDMFQVSVLFHIYLSSLPVTFSVFLRECNKE